ncbi:GTPase [Aureococcus anophagefferens]|nr:GTPase [Aureococcus anophagefferens]
MGDEEKVDQRQFKVILLGDGAVGKTSIATRFSSDEFTQSYKQTIGLDFFIKHLILPGDVHVAMQMWDIGGQSISSKMLHNYIFGAHAILLCYDITNYESFANLEDWRASPERGRRAATSRRAALAAASLRARRPATLNLSCPAQANKCDLSHMRAVKSEVHNRFADENVLYSFMMSAKSGDQVVLRVAAVLSNTSFSRPEIEVESQTVVKATIVEHAQHDPNVHSGSVPAYTKSKSSCAVS